jgi:hypothetical protein
VVPAPNPEREPAPRCRLHLPPPSPTRPVGESLTRTPGVKVFAPVLAARSSSAMRVLSHSVGEPAPLTFDSNLPSIPVAGSNRHKSVRIQVVPSDTVSRGNPRPVITDSWISSHTEVAKLSRPSSSSGESDAQIGTL